MKTNEFIESNNNEMKSDESLTLLSHDSENNHMISIVLGALGNVLWELAKEVWSSATDTSRLNIKDLVDFKSFVYSMSKESQKTLESSLENAEKLTKLIDKAERNSDPTSARNYRNQLADTYEQMSVTASQEAYRFEETHPGQGEYAKRFAKHLLDISEKARVPGSNVPNLDIRDLRRSDSNLDQNNLLANAFSKESTNQDLSEALSILGKVKQGSLSSLPSSNFSSNLDIDTGLKILSQIKEDQQAVPANIVDKEPTAPNKSRDNGIGGL